MINCIVLESRAAQASMPESAIHGQMASSLICPTDISNKNKWALMGESEHIEFLFLRFDVGFLK